MNRHAIITVLCVAFVVAAGHLAAYGQRQEIDPERAAQVKAAYLLNFLRYTQWPASSFENTESPLIITLVGDCDLTNVLADAVLRSDPINGRRVVLRLAYVPQPDDDGRIDPEQLDRFDQRLRSSHMVHFCSLDVSHVRPILQRLDDANVLTVSDIPRFAESGGMLGLVLREGAIRFQANPKEIQKTKLTVSAKVLRLAEIVETKP